MPSIRNVMSIKLIAMTTPIQFLPLPMKFLSYCSMMHFYRKCPVDAAYTCNNSFNALLP